MARTAQSVAIGGLAGLVGGLVASMFMTAVAMSGGGDAWVAAKIAAAPFVGVRAMAPGFDGDAVILGVIGHVAVSAVWGALFGLVALRLPAPAAPAAGVLWGMIVWLVMYYVLLPVLGIRYVVTSTPLAVAAGQHMVFGLAVALTFVALRRWTGSSVRPEIRSGTPTPHHTAA
jgi:hypothetical protein